MQSRRDGNNLTITLDPREEFDFKYIQRAIDIAKEDNSVFRLIAMVPAEMFAANKVLLNEIFIEDGDPINNGDGIFIRLLRVIRTDGQAAGALTISPTVPVSPLEQSAAAYYRMTRQPMTPERLAYLNSLGKKS